MQMLSRRFQGLVLMALVFVTVIIVLTVIQAVKHDWFIYSGKLHHYTMVFGLYAECLALL